MIKTIANKKLLEECPIEGYNYQLDTYIGCLHDCLYCFALAELEDEGKEGIYIHANLVPRLEEAISNIEPQTIYIGMRSDPYQKLERTSKQTRQVLELLKHKGFSACILTKSDMVTRDINLFKEMPGSSVGFSISFHEETDRLNFERRTPSINNRIKALNKLRAAGIFTYVLICPVLPYITDTKKVINRVKQYTDQIWIYPLNIKTDDNPIWSKLKRVLLDGYPHLASKYTPALLASKHEYWEKLRKDLEEINRQEELDLIIQL